MYSRATISECVIPQWRDKTILPQEKLFMMDKTILHQEKLFMVGQNDHASGEELEGGGVTDDTYSKRYVLFWAALGCALHTSFL
jgi:hypothetical protein